jgi:hypothetical protein
MSTFEIIDHGRAIRCRLCGRTSFHLVDVSQRYCGACNLFHDDLAHAGMRYARQRVPYAVPLGRIEGYDLYVGLQPPLPPTLIARYGDEPDEYETFNPWLLGAENVSSHGPHFVEALRRATLAGISLEPDPATDN